MLHADGWQRPVNGPAVHRVSILRYIAACPALGPFTQPKPDMANTVFPDDLVTRDGGGGRILLVVLDGLGGLPDPSTGRTELETAHTPNLDRLAARASLGMLVPVAPGIAPGSGPGHLALFGYDPVRFQIGRGVLSALGVGFQLEPGDVAARLNLATLDDEGRVTDRRAGRPSDDVGRRVIGRLEAALRLPEGVGAFLRHEKEHRAVLILRASGLGPDVTDTDPQETGVPPIRAQARSPGSERTAELIQSVLDQAREALADEPAANGLLARGIDGYEAFPGFRDRYGLEAAAVARYPMYRGVARLVGMNVPGAPRSDDEAHGMLAAAFPKHDFCFFHVKAPDARGEDRDFPAKVRAIEEADALVGRIAELEPDVLIVTGDHSTPATYGAHSWHAVPILLASRWSRPSASTFGEDTCRLGDLGTFRGMELMSLALAHAGRLPKFGA